MTAQSALKPPVHFVLYLALFGSTIFINKYVLSVLCFTYPTIYQGWQTLVGAVLLRLLLHYSSWLPVSPTPLDKAGFISLLPSFLFFVAGIVASSKALASLSVGMFLCLHNGLAALLYLFDVCPPLCLPPPLPPPVPPHPPTTTTTTPEAPGRANRVALAAAITALLAAVAAVLGDIDIMQFSDSPYLWLLVSLSCVAVQRLHSRISDARYTAVDRLYFSYVFSVVLLAPASLYLEEAFQVLRFPHASRLDFMAACVLAGLLGLLLSLHTDRMSGVAGFGRVDAGSRLLTALMSLAVFEDETSTTVKSLMLVSLVLGLFVPAPQPRHCDAHEEDEDNQTLLPQDCSAGV